MNEQNNDKRASEEPEQETELSSVDADESVESMSEVIDVGGSAIYEDLSQAELIEKLLKAEQQVAGISDGYLRAKADVENVRRRTQNEIVNARKYAIEGFSQELLSVKDSLDQAAKLELDESQSEPISKMKEGIDLTLKQLDSVLAKFSVVEVDASVGVKFNPELHQAISMIPGGEIEPGHIVDVMQKGFTLKDRLLRPAMVIVAQSA